MKTSKARPPWCFHQIHSCWRSTTGDLDVESVSVLRERYLGNVWCSELQWCAAMPFGRFQSMSHAIFEFNLSHVGVLRIWKKSQRTLLQRLVGNGFKTGLQQESLLPDCLECSQHWFWTLSEPHDTDHCRVGRGREGSSRSDVGHDLCECQAMPCCVSIGPPDYRDQLSHAVEPWAGHHAWHSFHFCLHMRPGNHLGNIWGMYVLYWRMQTDYVFNIYIYLLLYDYYMIIICMCCNEM